MNMSMAFDETDDNSASMSAPQISEELCMILKTDDDRGECSCKAMSNFPIMFDEYLRN